MVKFPLHKRLWSSCVYRISGGVGVYFIFKAVLKHGVVCNCKTIYLELGFCPPQICGPQFHIEHAIIWNFVQQRKVGKSNKVVHPKSILHYEGFISHVHTTHMDCDT
jgi:hypothetical protein